MTSYTTRISSETNFRISYWLKSCLAVCIFLSLNCSKTLAGIESMRADLEVKKKILLASKDKQERIESNLRISDIYIEYFHNIDYGIFYAKCALREIGNNIQSRNYIRAKIYIARAYYINGQPNRCVPLLDSIYNLSKEINYPFGIYRALYYKSLLYNDINEPDSAIKFLMEAVQVNKKSNASEDLASTYNSLGNLYFSRRAYHTALDYNFQSLAIWKKIKPQTISGVLSDIGNCYYYLNELDSALQFYNASLATSIQQNNNLGYGYGYNNIGLVYFKKDKYETALKYYDTALSYYYKMNSRVGITNCLDNICKTYLAKKDFDKAFRQAQIALAYVLPLHDKNLAYMIYNDLSTASAGQKNFEKAFFYQKIITAYADSIYGASKASSDAALQARLSILQKENENKLLRLEQTKQNIQLKQKNLVSIVIGIFLVLAIGAVIYFIRNAKLRYEAMQLLQKQNDVIEKNNHELDHLNSRLQSQKHELEEINLLKDKLFSIISHDIRSPLVSFSAYLSFLQAGEIPEDSIKALNNEVMERLNLTLNFVDNLIEWAQGQIQGTNRISELINLKHTCDEMLGFYQPQADMKNIKLINTVSPNINVYTNAGMVKMILRNLISNAIKFSFKDSSINISAETDEHFVIIHVADTGIGMREEDLAQLFSGKNYSRMGTSNEKGSGLGLTLCKEFLQKNNGTMWVDSEENKGSTFSFKIPISDKNLA